MPKTLLRLDMPWFDERAAIQTREVSVFTGRPGAGKTTFVCCLVDRLIRKCPQLQIGLATLEADVEELLNNSSLMEGRRLITIDQRARSLISYPAM